MEWGGGGGGGRGGGREGKSVGTLTVVISAMWLF